MITDDRRDPRIHGYLAAATEWLTHAYAALARADACRAAAGDVAAETYDAAARAMADELARLRHLLAVERIVLARLARRDDGRPTPPARAA